MGVEDPWRREKQINLEKSHLIRLQRSFITRIKERTRIKGRGWCNGLSAGVEAGSMTTTCHAPGAAFIPEPLLCVLVIVYAESFRPLSD